MKFVFLVGLLVLASCVAGAAKPASVGMTVDEYRLACPLNGLRLSDGPGFTVGECDDKPREYVEFQSGRLVAILTPEETQERLAAATCKVPEEFVACRAKTFQFFAEYESAKAEKGRVARKQAWSDFANRFGPASGTLSSSGGMGFVPEVPDPPSFNSPSGSSINGRLSRPRTMGCTLRSEETAGFNKICLYDCMGSPVAITQSSVSLCPLHP